MAPLLNDHETYGEYDLHASGRGRFSAKVTYFLMSHMVWLSTYWLRATLIQLHMRERRESEYRIGASPPTLSAIDIDATNKHILLFIRQTRAGLLL